MRSASSSFDEHRTKATESKRPVTVSREKAHIYQAAQEIPSASAEKASLAYIRGQIFLGASDDIAADDCCEQRDRAFYRRPRGYHCCLPAHLY
jgi:hypothetical protein